jgi:putative hydrolase of the HAD superfamily
VDRVSLPATERKLRGLIFDFGGVIIKTPFELLRPMEARLGLAPHTLDWHGPFAPERDELWRRMQQGEITERDYWHERAVEAGAAVGAAWTMRELVANLEASEDEFVRPEGRATLEAAHAAGIPIAMLTNDLEAFHGAAWFPTLSLAPLFDFVVDGSLTGFLKPDPRSYALALEALGLEAHEALFVDDQPRNAEGAEAVGLRAVKFDVTQPAESFARALTLFEI